MIRAFRTAICVFSIALTGTCNAVVTVDVEARRLDFDGDLLTPRMVDKILMELRSNPAVDTVRFTNVPGGVVAADQALRKVIGKYVVEVKGVCFSSCAMVALAGRELHLLKEEQRESIGRLP